MAIILDPRWPKRRSARLGRDACFAWLTLNGLPPPGRVFLSLEEANAWRPPGEPMIMPEWAGSYVRATRSWPSALALNLDGCVAGSAYKDHAGARRVQGAGSPTDFTPYGTFCHEVGHHVDYLLGKASRSKAFRRVVEDEPEVSDAEHNVLESFAEAIRLFVTNPDLLRLGRPLRWSYLRKRLQLKPPHACSWRQVTRRQHRCVKRSIERWLDA